MNKRKAKHSKLRVIVEHTVSRIKKFGIMGTKFRNRLGRYDHASDIVSGLVNFRIMRIIVNPFVYEFIYVNIPVA